MPEWGSRVWERGQVKQLVLKLGLGLVLLGAPLRFSVWAQANSNEAQIIREYMSQAEQALRSGHPDVAGRAYEKVLQLDPNNVDARGNLGVVDMSTGNWGKAAENLAEAYRLQPSQVKVQALLGICLFHLGRAAEAQDILAVAFPALDDSRLKREAGLA